MIERIFGKRRQGIIKRDFVGDDPEYVSLNPIELLKKEIRTKRMERVPVENIALEAPLVDEGHVESLAESMSGERGQISPMTVRIRLVEQDQIRYDTIDGFHRAAALARIRQEDAECVVLYGCTDEEMFDLRVLAANSVRSVKFARMAKWMQNSFDSAQWKQIRIKELIKTEDLTIAQVFSITRTDTDGSRLGLRQDEAEELKSWARKKAKQWNRPVSTLAIELRTVDLAAPDLVQQVRTGGGGSGGKGVLTHARLRAIVEPLRGEWELQRKIVDLVLEHNFLANETGRLASLILSAKDDQDKLKLILDYPRSFVGERQKSVTKTTELSENVQGETDVSSEGVGSRRTVFSREQPKYSDLTPHKLLEQDIRTERVEDVSVSNIVLEAAIVDDRHVNSLARSISGPRGQISPMTLRARDAGDGKIHYDVIDGFHRAYALGVLQRDTAKSVVLYGCSDEELFDLRVLAANSVRSVEFARIARWMQHSFAQTEWAKKGLSLSQTFALEVTETDVASRLGLTREETVAARKWVREKAEIWQRPVSTIWQTTRAIDAAAPGLILSVRVGGGGSKSRKGELSPAQFKAVIFPLAGEHQLQIDVAEVVARENLTSESASALAWVVARAKEEPEKVKTILSNPSSALGWDYVSRKVAGPSSRAEPPFKGYIEELDLEQEVTVIVAEYEFDTKQEAELLSLIQSAKEQGKSRRIGLILNDPLFFVGKQRESVIEISEVLSAAGEEIDNFSYEIGERTASEQMIVTSDNFKSKPETFEQIKQKLAMYQEIIKKQNIRIKRLEEELVRDSQSEDIYPTRKLLLERAWGLVEFNTLTGEVGSEEVGFVELTPTERAILGALVRYKRVPLDYRTLVTVTRDEVGEFIPEDKEVLWVHMSRLRQKLETISPLLVGRIKRVKEYGYMWE